ncbi:MAG: PLDc N-terminal domain-containing protein [Prolixibacteraceae bacterium]
MIMYILGLLGPQELLVIFLIIGMMLLLPLIALISILTNSFEGNDKLIWVLVVLLLPVLGPILYFLIGRSKRISEK